MLSLFFTSTPSKWNLYQLPKAEIELEGEKRSQCRPWTWSPQQMRRKTGGPRKPGMDKWQVAHLPFTARFTGTSILISYREAPGEGSPRHWNSLFPRVCARHFFLIAYGPGEINITTPRSFNVFSRESRAGLSIHWVSLPFIPLCIIRGHQSLQQPPLLRGDVGKWSCFMWVINPVADAEFPRLLPLAHWQASNAYSSMG